jgi:hypothetical protein
MDRPTTGNEDFDRQIRRTLVPAIVAVIIARAARYGLALPADALTGILEAIIFGFYYLTVATVERYVPAAGILIGAIGRPSYVTPGVTFDIQEDDGADG